MTDPLTAGFFASLFGGGGAAAGASLGGGLAATATATAGGAAAASSSALSILQGVASAIAAIGAVGTGISAMAASEEAADQTELQAGQEKVQATQRQTQMKRELLRILGENDVAFAAGGVDVGAGGGIAEQARASARKEAATEINIDRDNDEYRRALLRVRSRGLRRRGGEQLLSGFGQAAGIGLDYRIDQIERGV